VVRRTEPRDAGKARPVRTCVGCRQRANASELLRVVAVGSDASGQIQIVPDPRRRKPGRGAHVHPVPACLALAERRRAFGRALRVTGVCDLGPLREAIQGGDLRPNGS
jgi:predicted RNA-binding protein YlxR (DUF448 family)